MIILTKFDSQEEMYDFKALRFAEKYGVIDYKVESNHMEYYKEYWSEGGFTHTINLDTMKEIVIKTKKAYWELRG
jgi:lipopolysaccharide export system protein LptC